MIVVTGATGHIGNTLVRALLATGEEVRCLVLPGEDLRPLEGLGVELREGDVRHREALDRTFRGARVVYHLASVIDLLPRHAALRVLRNNSHISHAKATRELGYHPRPLRESLADTVKWFREVGWGDGHSQ